MEVKFVFFITWLVFLNWLRCQKEYFPLLFLLFSSNINIIKSSRMLPLSRNKQKPITVNPEGSLSAEEAKKSREKPEYVWLYLSSLPSFLRSHFHSPVWILSRPGKGGRMFVLDIWLMCWKVWNFLRAGSVSSRAPLWYVCSGCRSKHRAALGTKPGERWEGAPSVPAHCPPSPPAPDRKCAREDTEEESVRGMGRSVGQRGAHSVVMATAVWRKSCCLSRELYFALPGPCWASPGGPPPQAVFSRLPGPGFCLSGWFPRFDHFINITKLLLSR